MRSAEVNALVLLLIAVAGCATEPSSTKRALTSSGTITHRPAEELRSPEATSRALEEAQSAYLDGRWGDAVTKSTAVIEGAASPEDYYMAVKILGMASCARRDPRPVNFAWKRLQAADRDSLKNACAQHGLIISEQGVITGDR